jgi:hypothetical protein
MHRKSAPRSRQKNYSSHKQSNTTLLAPWHLSLLKLPLKKRNKLQKSFLLAVLQSSLGEVSGSDTGHQQKRRHNAIIRLINVIFSEELVERIVSWNDSRDRTDSEDCAESLDGAKIVSGRRCLGPFLAESNL